jgi:hypothetical protein
LRQLFLWKLFYENYFFIKFLMEIIKLVDFHFQSVLWSFSTNMQFLFYGFSQMPLDYTLLSRLTDFEWSVSTQYVCEHHTQEWFLHAECGFGTYECHNHFCECQNHTHTCQHHTLRVAITLVHVEITVVSVVIIFVRVKITRI